MSAFSEGVIWAALPTPAIVVGGQNIVEALNPAAEMFLNTSERNLIGRKLLDALGCNIDLASDLDRVRKNRAVLVHRDVSVFSNSPNLVNCDLQITTLGNEGQSLLVLLQPRQIAGRLGKVLQAKTVAKTAIGLADMLAHEIKNPLAGITGAAQLLAMNLEPDDQELVDLILQETRRIVDLLKQVEQFGDLREPRLKRVNVHDALERARKSTSLGVAGKMRFQDDYDPSLPSVSADSEQLVQVFTNLFANAAEAAGEKGGQITIRTYYEIGLRFQTSKGERALPIQIEISDDGPGVPETLAESLFEPFVSSRENGTGLGLALVSKIVSEHNGSISVNSRPGKTTFRISLPVAEKTNGGR